MAFGAVVLQNGQTLPISAIIQAAVEAASGAGGWERVATIIREATLTDQVAMGAAAPPDPGAKLYVEGTADPAAGDATMRVRALAGQTGDLARWEDDTGALRARIAANGALVTSTEVDTGNVNAIGTVNAGSVVAGPGTFTGSVTADDLATTAGNITSAQDVLATRDVSSGRDVLCTRFVVAAVGAGFFGASSATTSGEVVRASRSLASTSGTMQTLQADITLSGLGTGGGTVVGGRAQITTSTNAAPNILVGQSCRAIHGATGAVAVQMVGAQSSIQVSAAAGLTIGNVAAMVGFQASPFVGSQLASSVTAYTAFEALSFIASAAKTFTTATTLRAPNYGQTGVTNSIGVDIDRQTGASGLNIGLRNAGSTALPWFTPAALTGNTNDWPNPLATNARISATGLFDLTGIAGGFDGQELCLVNVGASSITLRNQDAGSAAANRFILAGGTPKILMTDGSIALTYDATTARWRQTSPLI